MCDVKWLLRVSECWLRVGEQLVTAGRRRAAGARANGSVYGFMCVDAYVSGEILLVCLKLFYSCGRLFEVIACKC